MIRTANWLRFASAKSCLVALFMLCALPTGIFLALLTPPGQVPDEPNHYARADALRRGIVLVTRHRDVLAGEVVAARVNASLYAASFGDVTMQGNEPKVTMRDDSGLRNRAPSQVLTAVRITNTATYFPAFYAPAAAAFAAGLSLRESPYQVIELGRLSMLAAFLALGVAAVWVAAYGEALLMGVLLLPMTLFLAASLNQDGVLIGAACLAAACLTRAERGWRVFGAALLVLVLGAKPPYLPLLALLLLPLIRPGLGKRCGLMLAAAVPVLLWSALVLRYTAVPFNKLPYHPGPLWQGPPGTVLTATGAAANLHILLAAPSRFLLLPWRTLLNGWPQPLREMIGVLGLLQIQFSETYYLLWGGALLVALAAVPFSHPPGPGNWNRLLFVPLLVAGCYWAVMVSMYVNWTNVGLALVDGMQGRYLIPLLPFLLLALPGVRRRAVLPAILPALPVLALGGIDLIYLPVRFANVYYVH